MARSAAVWRPKRSGPIVKLAWWRVGVALSLSKTKQMQFIPGPRAVKPFRKENSEMAATALATPLFVRRTQLGANEYRKNFHQIDRDVIAALTSEEADRVTPLMSKVYLRLASSPTEFWEREGVLRFAGGEENGRWVTAWAQLVARVG